MTLTRLTLALVVLGLAASTLSRKSAARAATDGTPTGDAGPTANRTASSADSPNAAERLQGRRPANSMVGSDRTGAGLRGSDASTSEYATSTGLADFTRGA